MVRRYLAVLFLASGPPALEAQVVLRTLLPNADERLSLLTSTRLPGEDLSSRLVEVSDLRPDGPPRACNCDSLIEAASQVKPGINVGKWSLSFPAGPFVTDAEGSYLTGVFAGVSARRGGWKFGASASYSNLELFLADGAGGENRVDINGHRLKAKVVAPTGVLGSNGVLKAQRTASPNGIDSNEFVAGVSREFGDVEVTYNEKYIWDETAPSQGTYMGSSARGIAVAWKPVDVFELEAEIEREDGEHELAFTGNHSLNFLGFRSTVKFAVKSSAKVDIGYTAIIP